MPDSLSISALASQPYIRITGSGLWTALQLEQHFHELDRALKIMRTRKGFALVLADFREAKVQTAEAAQVIRKWTGHIYCEGDRVAAVCGTSLLAMQIRHQAKIGNLRTFSDHDLAIEWLLAEAGEDVASRALRTA